LSVCPSVIKNSQRAQADAQLARDAAAAERARGAPAQAALWATAQRDARPAARDDARRAREAQQREQQEQQRLAAERRNLDALALLQQRAYYNNFGAFVMGRATPATAAAAMQLLGPWRGVVTIDLPDPDLAAAQQALGMVAAGQRHSAFYVPFLRAAQGLGDARIPFLRAFFGPVNWDALVQRQSAVFQAAGITGANTPWQQGAMGGYVGEPQQLALLALENGLRHSGWPAAPAVGAGVGALGGLAAGQAYEALVRRRLDAARRRVEEDNNNEFV